jgi:hypothetical protein
MSVETIVSIILGVILFKEDLRGSPGLLAVSIVALAFALVGLVILARSEGRAHEPLAREPAESPA